MSDIPVCVVSWLLILRAKNVKPEWSGNGLKWSGKGLKWSGNGLKWSGSDHEMAINGQVVVLKGHEMA